MVTQRNSIDTLQKLIVLGDQGTFIPNGWRFNKLEKGMIVAVMRYGHHSAARMFAKAKLPIYSALRLIQIAMMDCGYRYRKPLAPTYSKQS